MLRTCYSVYVSYTLFSSEGEFEECNGETYYADTLDEAYSIADKHAVGEIECEYPDGSYGIIDSVEVDPEPHTMDFY